jgi:hypothetical protein
MRSSGPPAERIGQLLQCHVCTLVTAPEKWQIIPLVKNGNEMKIKRNENEKNDKI